MEIQIGWWRTMCCHLDLEEITSEMELEEAQDWVEEGLGQAWPSKDEALMDIAKRWENSGYPDTAREVRAMIGQTAKEQDKPIRETFGEGMSKIIDKFPKKDS